MILVGDQKVNRWDKKWFLVLYEKVKNWLKNCKMVWDKKLVLEIKWVCVEYDWYWNDIKIIVGR